ncbi:hypothetical protein CEXT_709581 [Caerostris extrusa]|uniref:Uncharacterized protein n=1 Tax=Caerostris extrusa TaxID=172846 RepID=A0AAV4UAS1_CAEEX|nr:hypothetical protein CEXT_709581 [Caerostris extrusa]
MVIEWGAASFFFFFSFLVCSREELERFLRVQKGMEEERVRSVINDLQPSLLDDGLSREDLLVPKKQKKEWSEEDKEGKGRTRKNKKEQKKEEKRS